MVFAWKRLIICIIIILHTELNVKKQKRIVIAVADKGDNSIWNDNYAEYAIDGLVFENKNDAIEYMYTKRDYYKMSVEELTFYREEDEWKEYSLVNQWMAKLKMI